MLLRQVLKDSIEENLVEERTVGEGTIVCAVTPRAGTVRGTLQRTCAISSDKRGINLRRIESLLA